MYRFFKQQAMALILVLGLVNLAYSQKKAKPIELTFRAMTIKVPPSAELKEGENGMAYLNVPGVMNMNIQYYFEHASAEGAAKGHAERMETMVKEVSMEMNMSVGGADYYYKDGEDAKGGVALVAGASAGDEAYGILVTYENKDGAKAAKKAIRSIRASGAETTPIMPNGKVIEFESIAFNVFESSQQEMMGGNLMVTTGSLYSFVASKLPGSTKTEAYTYSQAGNRLTKIKKDDVREGLINNKAATAYYMFSDKGDIQEFTDDKGMIPLEMNSGKSDKGAFGVAYAPTPTAADLMGAGAESEYKTYTGIVALGDDFYRVDMTIPNTSERALAEALKVFQNIKY